MQSSRQVPIAEGLFTWEDGEARLLGGRCGACGTVTFPRATSCPRCAEEVVLDEPLARRGTLWTWTVQAFPPTSPPYTGPMGEAFEPFAVGYVELPDQVKVEARLVAEPPALRIGAAMELVLLPVRVDAEGNEVFTFAFAPAEEVAS
ncbi:MAG TPA: OB-fold domain-containing protein [Acidimicrobiales bacterium]|nr:OB-fold domain-containing protein [Acidimicrobiales bacterium]